MKYHFIRLFLIKREQPPLLVISGDIKERATRLEYLIDILSKRIDFIHKTKKIVYIPFGKDEREDGPVLLGRVGREFTETENQPPENDFQETTHESWKAANLLIDIRNHPDGQKIAFQHRHQLGTPLPIIQSLAAHINTSNPDSGWLIEANPITDKTSFWEAAENHKGSITAAIFTFITPNILKLKSQLNDDLKEARNIHNAQRVSQTLENQDGGLILASPEVEDSIEYISEGGGTAKLKSGKKIIYDSDREQKIVEIDDEKIASNNNDLSIWRTLSLRIFR